MSLSVAALRVMAEKGLSLDDILEIAEAMETRTSGAERQKRYRERQRDVTRNVTESDVTDGSALDKESVPQTPFKEINPTSAKRNAGAGKGSRLPDDFEPRIIGLTAEMVERWPPGRLDREVAQFRDHYTKTGGDKGLSRDWQASLRTWLRNADDRMPRNGLSQSQPSGIGRTAAAAIAVFGHPGEAH